MALESATPTLVDAALRSLPIILPVLDFSTIKNDLFPIIANIFSKTNSLAIKVRGLQAFVTLCGGDTGNDGLDGFAPDRKKSSASALDKYTMQEKIVPLIKVIKTKEPAVMMAALTALKVIGQVADAEFVAMDILPILWSMSLGPLLDLKQFQAFMELIKSLSGRVIDEQTKKLQELSTSNNRATSGLNDDFMSFNAIPGSSLDANGTTEADFEMLVKGKTGPPSHSTNPLESGWDSMSSPVPTVTSPGATIRSPPTPAAATFSWSSTPPPAPSTLKPLQQQQPAFRTVTPDLTHFNTLTPTTTQFSQPLQPTTPSSGPINWGTTTAPAPVNPWASQPQQPPTNAFSAMSLGGGGGQMSRPAAVPSSSSFSLPPPPGAGGGGGGGAKGLSGFSLAPPPGAAGPQASAFGVPSPAVASLQGNMGAGMGMGMAALGGGGMGGGGMGGGMGSMNSMGSLMNNRGGMGMGMAPASSGMGMGMGMAGGGGMGMGMMAQQQQQQQQPQQQQGQKSGLAKYESLL